ncbi:MAG: hypothetical protein A2506_09275 [Elusimicrobia bacterium RIFOXYD12_FULL_66_9]|nr:MAG: hypothetical protein A2506_09275 [Elusimicrobia bacterium RIFOXYD12_FULL_66_9]
MTTVRRVCSWCKKSLGTVEGDFDPRFPITHSICPDCSRRAAAEMGLKTIQEFLDDLGVPVLMMDDDARVLAASRRAQDVLGKDLPQLVGEKGGDVIECVAAKLPGGCGKSLHCRACAIRNSVTKTYQTGEPCLRVPAYPDVQIGDEVRTLSLLITTEKVGACVLLRIDDIREEG